MKRFAELVMKLVFVFVLCPAGFILLAIDSRISIEQGLCLSITVLLFSILISIALYREELVGSKQQTGRFQPLEAFCKTFGC